MEWSVLDVRTSSPSSPLPLLLLTHLFAPIVEHAFDRVLRKGARGQDDGRMEEDEVGRGWHSGVVPDRESANRAVNLEYALRVIVTREYVTTALCRGVHWGSRIDDY
jgi:hypothetical protein